MPPELAEAFELLFSRGLTERRLTSSYILTRRSFCTLAPSCVPMRNGRTRLAEILQQAYTHINCSSLPGPSFLVGAIILRSFSARKPVVIVSFLQARKRKNSLPLCACSVKAALGDAERGEGVPISSRVPTQSPSVRLYNSKYLCRRDLVSPFTRTVLLRSLFLLPRVVALVYSVGGTIRELLLVNADPEAGPLWKECRTVGINRIVKKRSLFFFASTLQALASSLQCTDVNRTDRKQRALSVVLQLRFSTPLSARV